MNVKAVSGRTALLAMGLAALSACTGAVSVKEVTDNEQGYLANTFAPASLPKAIATKLPPDASPPGVKRLEIVAEAKAELTDGKTDSWRTDSTFVEEGKGIVREVTEASRNNIPYARLYSLTYRGIFDLKWQRVPLQGTTTGQIYEVKEITKFDPIPRAAGAEFEVDYTSGPQIQIANLRSFRKVCKATGVEPAARIHAKLAGEALMLDCELHGNHTVLSRSKWAMLLHYGAAIGLENTNSSRKTTYKVVDVRG